MTETLGWIQLGKRYIRKCTLYEPMCWNAGIDFNKHFVSISRYGGLIALANRESNNGRNLTIHIYNAAGKEISSFKWNSGPFLGMGWTNSDDLLCIQEDGQLLLYDIFGQFIRIFSMGKECRDHRVLEYEIFLSSAGTGIVIMNGLYRFMVVNNIDEPKIRILSQVPGLKSTPPSSWCALPGPRGCCVLAANDDEIYLLDQGDHCTRQYPTGLSSEPASYIYMSVSLDRKHVALYTNEATVWIGSSDFKEKYCELRTNEGGCPKQMLWCCNCVVSFGSASNRPADDKALVIYWLKKILVIGPGKDWVRYDVEEDYSNASTYGSAVLCADVDGVHIVTANRHEYLQHVPKTVEDIYFPGSVEPGSVLYDASKEYERQSEKADEYLRILLDKNELERAVEQCIIASTFEFVSRSQKQLLRAASFGKTFRPELELTDLFVNACQYLRVLNALHDFNVGIALTAAQISTCGTSFERIFDADKEYSTDVQ